MSRRLWTSVVASFALVAIAALSLWLFVPPAPTSTGVTGRIALAAMQRGDGATLMSVGFPEELHGTGVTADELSKLYQELVVPRLNRLERDGDVSVEDNGSNATVGQMYRNRFGKSLPFSTLAVHTGQGNKVSVFAPLYLAWCLEYFDEHDEPFSLESRNRAVLEGLRKDKEALRAMGVETLTDVDVVSQQVKLMSLERMEEGYARWVADPSLKPAP